MTDRDKAVELIKAHDLLDKQIQDTREQLIKLGAGHGESLFTLDGFPRHDIDVSTARQLRVQLIRQENDMKELREQIRQALITVLPAKATKMPLASTLKPFCVVKSVLSGSLGDEAGLQADDQLIKFGDIRKFSDLSAEFSRSAGSTLTINVYRPFSAETITVEVRVAPKRSLGCHLVPL